MRIEIGPVLIEWRENSIRKWGYRRFEVWRVEVDGWKNWMVDYWPDEHQPQKFSRREATDWAKAMAKTLDANQYFELVDLDSGRHEQI